MRYSYWQFRMYGNMNKNENHLLYKYETLARAACIHCHVTKYPQLTVFFQIDGKEIKRSKESQFIMDWQL